MSKRDKLQRHVVSDPNHFWSVRIVFFVGLVAFLNGVGFMYVSKDYCHPFFVILALGGFITMWLCTKDPSWKK
ncbi:MAG: hypothetical protein JW880_05015 [Candidatus Thermoplasmatota archaeon]|nr:hypothetical protein [Candidatus Thermoplasmatota archaeon]